MKLTLKESMDMLKKAELNRIKSELEPHFEEYGDLYITGAEDDTIKIEFNKGVCNYAFDNVIVNMSMNGLIDNCYENVYNNTGLEPYDIFEEVGNNLTELGIKPVEPFHLEDWKKQLTEKYDLQIGEDGCILTKEGHVVIVDDNNVNNINWHNGDLIGHEKFRFNNNGGVYLKTKADCSEFERVFSNYIKKQSLYTICDDLKQHLSENFRDKLQVGESDHYGDCILYDDADVVINIKNYSNTFNNQWYSWLSNAGTLSSHINDIFEDVGPALEEIKVKTFKPFDIELWKQQFAKNYDLKVVDGDILTCDGDIIVFDDNDVNTIEWHKGALKGHSKFKFDELSDVCLKTKQDCLEFEKVFSDYLNEPTCLIESWKQDFVETYELSISADGYVEYNDKERIMKTTTKEIIKEILNKELEKIKDELTPHFKDFGELYIIHDNLSINIGGVRYTILCMNADGTMDNTYHCVYNLIEISPVDIFEEIGYSLEEIKIKPVKNFDINEWKKSFIEKYELSLKPSGRVAYNNSVLISEVNDVNCYFWHAGTLGGHQKFAFDGLIPVYLKTEDDCLEFEEIFSNYFYNQKYKTIKELFPQLSTDERESIGYKFAEIARTLDIDIMYNKQEADYFCNAYNISQEKADMILSLVKGDN